MNPANQKPYNPLEKDNLGRSVIRSMLKSTPTPLKSVEPFAGAGVYAIYYLGDFDAYQPLRHWNTGTDNLQVPIYVGKAIPKGGRKGLVVSTTFTKCTTLFSRLEDHRKSVESAANLSINDFHCRYLVVDDIWIPLGESLLIDFFNPIWNSEVDGFGNHDPGKGRHQGAKPSWDTLHPGRAWAGKCSPAKLNESAVRMKIARFWSKYQGPKPMD